MADISIDLNPDMVGEAYGSEAVETIDHTTDIFGGQMPTENDNDADYDYAGNLDVVELAVSGPPGLGSILNDILQYQFNQSTYTWNKIESLETPNRQLFGLTVWGNYAFRVYFHGTPFVALALAPIVWGIIAAIVVAGFTVTVWRVVSAIQSGQTIDVTKSVLAGMQTGTVKDKASATALNNLTGGTQPTDWTQLAKWGIIGVVGVLGLSAVMKAV